MNLYFTLTAEDRVLAVHQTIDSAREFVAGWKDFSGANRVAARIVVADRDAKPIYARSDRFKVKMITEQFAL